MKLESILGKNIYKHDGNDYIICNECDILQNMQKDLSGCILELLQEYNYYRKVLGLSTNFTIHLIKISIDNISHLTHGERIVPGPLQLQNHECSSPFYKITTIFMHNFRLSSLVCFNSSLNSYDTEYNINAI